MKTVPLAEVASINPRRDSVPADSEVSFVGMAELDAVSAAARPLETRTFSEVSKGYTVFRDGDVLAAKITPCWENGKVGQAHLNHAVGVGSTEFHVLRPGPELDDRYLLHFLRQPLVRKAGELRMTGSAGQKRVPPGFLQGLEIPLPPLTDQRRIVAILDHTDALRAKRRQVLDHLDSLTQSIFNDMFGAVDWLTEFDSVIASGPTNGMYRPASDYGDGVPILRIENFSSGEVLVSSGNWKRLRADESEIRRYALHVGDIVVNRVNALSHLGKSALVAAIGEPSVYESNMMRIRIDPSRACPDFVLAWLQSARTKQQILRKAKKAINQASINQTDVRSLLLPLPSLELQLRFAARIAEVSNQRAVMQRWIDAEDSLFDSLQARAFRGEL